MIILKLKKGLSALFISVMILSLSSCNSNISMYINSNTGSNYKYHILTSITSTTEINNQKSTTTQDTTTDFIFSVDEVDSEGNLTLSYKYDKIKLDIDTNGAKNTIDTSSSDQSNTESAMYKSIIGKGFTTKVTKLGEVTEVNGIETLIDSMIESVYSSDDEDMKAYADEVKENLTSSFGEKSIKSLIQQATKIFPDKNVKVGTSWEIPTTVNSVVEIDTKTIYKLEKVKDNIAYISVKSEYKTDSSKPSDYMGMEMTTDITGIMSGTIKVDTRDCLISEGELTQTTKGSMSLKAPETEGGQSETVQIPVDTLSKINYSTTKM